MEYKKSFAIIEGGGDSHPNVFPICCIHAYVCIFKPDDMFVDFEGI